MFFSTSFANKSSGLKIENLKVRMLEALYASLGVYKEHGSIIYIDNLPSGF
jgi:hypothetical protein